MYGVLLSDLSDGPTGGDWWIHATVDDFNVVSQAGFKVDDDCWRMRILDAESVSCSRSRRPAGLRGSPRGARAGQRRRYRALVRREQRLVEEQVRRSLEALGELADFEARALHPAMAPLTDGLISFS